VSAPGSGPEWLRWICGQVSGRGARRGGKTAPGHPPRSWSNALGDGSRRLITYRWYGKRGPSWQHAATTIRSRDIRNDYTDSSQASEHRRTDPVRHMTPSYGLHAIVSRSGQLVEVDKWFDSEAERDRWATSSWLAAQGRRGGDQLVRVTGLAERELHD